MSKLNIAIIGAGIGGMSAALGLAQSGFKVSVFEQAPELSEVGAGLTITPNATKGLNYLNLGEGIKSVGMAHTNQGVRHYETGEVIVPLERGEKMMQKIRCISVSGSSRRCSQFIHWRHECLSRQSSVCKS